MSYTALKRMQQKNEKQYGNSSVGPMQPAAPCEERMDLETAAVRFIYESCEDLRFEETDPSDEYGLLTKKEKEMGGRYLGTSAGPEQIPINMQKDIDRLCLQRAVERFLKSGASHDAFDVYFCYLEMFIGSYGQSRRMIELLSEFESNSSNLLMKHRDHYSHSVYVFVLGLAIYETNEVYRGAYKDFYKITDDRSAAHHFLRYWGLAALFHDIGYPFELPFEQVKSYFSERDSEENASGRVRLLQKKPFLSYSGISDYVMLDRDEKKRLFELYGRVFDSTDQLFAHDIVEKLGKQYFLTEESLVGILKSKPNKPDTFNHFMDHAYFSATVLFRELFDDMEPEEIGKAHIDALTAILLHNSLYKFSVAHYDKEGNLPLEIKLHPLAYMLMLCDELQCWDRTAYGRNSRSELHAMGCRFTFENNGIQATYLYDEAESKKVEKFAVECESYLQAMREGREKETKVPSLKACSDMILPDKNNRDQLRVAFERMLQRCHACSQAAMGDADGESETVPCKASLSWISPDENSRVKFQTDIERIVDINNRGIHKDGRFISLSVGMKMEKADNTGKRMFLSSSNFIHLYNFALALNAQYNNEETSGARMIEMFSRLSLEYKLSNVLQAKKFSDHLDSLGCFFTDRLVAYEMINSFSDSQLITLGEREHKRWEDEKRMMCWKSPVEGMEERCKEKTVREQTRMHYDLNVDFSNLPDGEKIKDMRPLNTMMEKLKEYDGLRIYRLPEKATHNTT